MAETKYIYSISLGTLNGIVETAALSKEINNSSIIIGVSRIETNDDVLNVYMKSALTAGDQTKLTLVVGAHEGVPLTPPPQQVEIKEEDEGTQGHYFTRSFELLVDQAQGEWKSMDITFPFAVSVFSGAFVQMPNMEGDIISISVAPDTVVGAITAPVNIGDTVFNCQDSVIENVSLGNNFKLYDGVNTNDCERVVGIDRIAKTVTVETPATNAFLATSPTYCQMTVAFVPHLMLRDRYVMEIGKDVIGGSLIPPGVVLRLNYQNNEGSTKTFSIVVEMKY